MEEAHVPFFTTADVLRLLHGSICIGELCGYQIGRDAFALGRIHHTTYTCLRCQRGFPSVDEWRRHYEYGVPDGKMHPISIVDNRVHVDTSVDYTGRYYRPHSRWTKKSLEDPVYFKTHWGPALLKLQECASRRRTSSFT